MSEEEKRTFQSVTLGLPLLKMVLVHAENDRQNETTETILEPLETREQRKKEKAVRKIIEHLNAKP